MKQESCCSKKGATCYVLGPTGPTGPQGLPSATITVNSTKTGNPGTDAVVINSGDSNNVRLDFIIPAGKTGETPTLQIGTVKTGDPGTEASVNIRPNN